MDGLESIRNDIHDALDDVTSPRVSPERRVQALNGLENIIASASVSKDTSLFESIIALQYTFECNIPSRLLPWLSTCSPKLERLSGRSQPSEQEKHEALVLSSQLLPALSIIQGIVLSHPPSKAFLSRERNLEILIDLLLASRHISLPSSSPIDQAAPPLTSSPSKTASPTTFLSSAVLDTLLCVLVDSSSALRAFEECNGVQVIVKILKRMGTPREVRMKCLEFLYFYLMDETSPTLESVEPTPPPTAPGTPCHTSQHSQSQPAIATGKKKKPYLNNTPNRPMSRYGSSTYAFSSGSSSGITTGLSSGPNSRSNSRPGSRSGSEGTKVSGSGTFNQSDSSATSSTTSESTRSVSSGSANSFTSNSTSTSSTATGGTSTAPSSAASSPKKPAFISLPTIPSTTMTPPSSPPGLNQAFVFEPRTPSQKHKQKQGKPLGHPHLNQVQGGVGQGQVQQRALNMLKRDVDFVPQSPQRSNSGSNGGEGARRRAQGHARMRSGLGSMTIVGGEEGGQEREGKKEKEERTPKWTASRPELVLEDGGSPSKFSRVMDQERVRGAGEGGGRRLGTGARTMEEKKELLGTMLGNVDALVESVAKAGIWGLGG
ncbi:hypothetical protein K435DRAFT_847063 [Dendrothele bispora CBS 962.96]|uniref:CDC14-domain-containing protein n=1 Tax=Dendrothele bispora (strain CBS 962.96) TaxID=1314807 RepID=A0A4S8MYC8_DENBC|nr:hypothetical protein K435DRAFT_847063 [Dendrothele bispora CBS 962.96]